MSQKFSMFKRVMVGKPLASSELIAAAVVATGRQPRARVMDLLIAATAHAHGAKLYARNAGDLVGIESLVEVVTVQEAGPATDRHNDNSL